jgi:hypothetical protein
MAGIHTDLLDHLVTQGIGTKYNQVSNPTGILRAGRVQEAPDRAVFVKAVQGFKNIRGMGPSMGPPLGGDRPSFEVTVRDVTFVVAELLAKQVNAKFDHFTGVINGTDYKYIESLFDPHYLGVDENDRHLWFCRYRVTKERGSLV